MTRWNEKQYLEYIARRSIDLNTGTMVIEADEGPESRLQGKITKYCKDHGYPALSFRQSQKAKGFLTKGWADVTVLLPKSRTIFLELKSSKGILRAEQKGLKQIALYLGHEWYKVTSYRQFLGIVEAKNE
uniref:VRR-NUC domain-containing protein n=1 Tax=viral metagenome TaxID=1070528 RepID=A0A6M3LFT5_9ZZZZ